MSGWGHPHLNSTYWRILGILLGVYSEETEARLWSLSYNVFRCEYQGYSQQTSGYYRSLKCWSFNPARGNVQWFIRGKLELASFLAPTSKLLFNRDIWYCTILEEGVNFTICNRRRDSLQNNLLQSDIPTRKIPAPTDKGSSWFPLFLSQRRVSPIHERCLRNVPVTWL